MIRQIVWAAATLAMLVLPARAQEAGAIDLKPFEAEWQACTAQVSAIGNNWVGWHHVAGGGYG